MSSVSDVRLTVVQDLLDFFHRENIRYCHWKSNEHALAAVQGDTDLDILFDEVQYAEVSELLVSKGFFKYEAAWFVRYPYIEDYISIDVHSGKLIHVHAHFRLVLGEKRVKSYRLPWEDLILSRRVWMDREKIFASSPVDELLLLIIRAALKQPSQNNDQYAKSLDTGDIGREFAWLRQRVEPHEIQEVAARLINSDVCGEVARMLCDGITFDNLSAFKQKAEPALEGHRRYGRVQSVVVGFTRRVFAKFASINKRLALLNIANHRTLTSRGIIVALMGADGSGKSTQSRNIVAALSRKVDTVFIYMGSGSGPKSWHRQFLEGLRNKIGDGVSKKVGFAPEKTKRSGARPSLYRSVWAASLALEKRSKLRKAQKAKGRGAIVITDRYPQTQVQGFNDGPLLQCYEARSGSLLSLCSWIERKCYSFLEQAEPDLMIKLIGDIDCIHERRKESMGIEEIIKKQESIKTIEYGEKTITAQIDACLDPDCVFKQIMKLIKEAMTQCR